MFDRKTIFVCFFLVKTPPYGGSDNLLNLRGDQNIFGHLAVLGDFGHVFTNFLAPLHFFQFLFFCGWGGWLVGWYEIKLKLIQFNFN